MSNPILDLHEFLLEEVSTRGRVLASRRNQRHAVTLQALGELRRRVDLAITAAIHEASAAGYSNAAVAMNLGVTRQAVHKRLAGTAPAFTTAAED